MEKIEEFLGGLPLFGSFTPEELKRLAENSRLEAFAPKEAIIRFGQPGSFLGVVIEGKAEAVIKGKRGERLRLGLLRPGDFLGEMALLTGEPTSADVVALDACRIFLIPQEAFSMILAVKPEAVRVMAKTLSDRLLSRLQDEEELERVEDAWRSSMDPYGLRLAPPRAAKLLVIRSERSTLRFSYFDTAREDTGLEGVVKGIGRESAHAIASSGGGPTRRNLGPLDHGGALRAVLDLLSDRAGGVGVDPKELTAVGHRVAHGGEKYGNAVLVSDEVMEDIDRCATLAPESNPFNLAAVRESARRLPDVPQVAVFDTAFHQRMPLQAVLYGLPYEYYERDRIRRYGSYGISHHFAALEAAAYLKRDFRRSKLITCHLGEGASICAIDHGRSVDTSMGLTPLEGPIMSTRCGDLDPGIVLRLMKEKGYTVGEVDEILNRRSGLKGLSGRAGAFRDLEEAANGGEPRAVLAIHTFCYRVRKYIGAYAAALGGLDALVFTGSIGVGSAWVRSLVCQGLAPIGIGVDGMLNRVVAPKAGEREEITEEGSRVKVLVIPTEEERMICRETLRTLEYRNVARIIRSRKEREIPIEVSDHHVHLSRRETEALFGPGRELTVRSELSQPGHFACEETVTLVGPKGRVEGVRVIGPLRDLCQVEVTVTEELRLGLKAPIRNSRDLEGSPGITLEGPGGACEISQGVICSLRHVHMSPEEALSFGLKDRDLVMVKVKGERTLIFGDVLLRVHPEFRLSMHIDMDEAHAAGIRTGMKGTIIGVQDRR